MKRIILLLTFLLIPTAVHAEIYRKPIRGTTVTHKDKMRIISQTYMKKNGELI